MTVGLRIRNPADGSILMDTSTGLARLIGSVVTTVNQAGSVTGVSGFGSGTPFALSYAQGIPNIGSSQTYPVHSISGTTLSWNASPLASLIIYGVYAGTAAGKIGSGLVGFRALNGNLATQIDTSYANHCILTSGAINIPAGGDQTITVAATSPLFAYRGTNWVTVLQQINNGNGTWTLTIGAAQLGAVGTYYLFDVTTASSPRYATNIGLRIRSPTTGAVVYDSRTKYMRVVQVRANAAYELPPSSPVITALSQNNLAAIVDPGLSFYEFDERGVDGNGNPTDTELYAPYFVGAGVNGSTLTEGTVSVGSNSSVIPGSTQQGTTILVDVTGF